MRLWRRLGSAGIATVLAALTLAPASHAGTHSPTAEFAPFTECPWTDPEVTLCVHSELGGSYTLGNKTVPIVNPVTLQGGWIGEMPEGEFQAAENAETLVKIPQSLPGGLLGITAPGSWPSNVQEWFNDAINEGHTGVTATLELAAPVSAIALNTENILFEEGIALGLPVNVKLSNLILGGSCYIGPIQLNLTTGTSGELAGGAGMVNFNPGFTMVTFTGTELVDGIFEAPEAEGCGGAHATHVNPLINSIFGLLASSGKNRATLEGDLNIADAPTVQANDM